MMRLPARPARRGMVLLIVLMVVVLLTLAAYQYSMLMRAEFAAMTSYTRTMQSKGLIESGAHYGAAVLGDPFAIVSELGGNPYDNPSMFQDVVVSTDPATGRRGMFSIVTLPRPEDLAAGGASFRYGVTDEAGKLNLNALLQYDPSGTVGMFMLMQLPNMSEDIASSILDWLDADETPRPGGAENDVYSGMAPPYRCKNGPLDSLEELLLVSGVTPWLLYGNDVNRNGMLDANEDDGSGTVDLGWQAYLTVFSAERNVDGTGEPRIFLNDKTLITLNSLISDEFPDNPEVPMYLMAYRMYGGVTVTEDMEIQEPTEQLVQMASAKVMLDVLSKQGRNNVPSIWDLVTKTVLVPVRMRQGRNTVTVQVPLPNPFVDPEQARLVLPILFDKFTTTQSPDLMPRVNVSTAPATVLMMLPGLTEEDVAKIVAAQPLYSQGESADEIYATQAWLYTEAGLSAETLRSIDRFITARSQVYRFQIVGYTDGGGPMSRAEAVVDSNSGRPRIVYWRNLTDLGPGFPIGPNAQGQMSEPMLP